MRLDRILHICAMLLLVPLLFAANAYAAKVVPIAGPGGSMSPSEEQMGVDKEDIIIFTVTPDLHYQVADLMLRYDGNSEPVSVLSGCTWDDNQVVATYALTGVTRNCSLEASFAPIPVEASFVASPESGKGEASYQIQFTDTSQNDPTNWLWNFDDGTTSEAQNPIHTYASAGTYTVTLTVENRINQTADNYSAEYVVAEPTITYRADVGPNGSILPAGIVTVSEGTSTTFTITPDPLYQVADVLVDGETVGPVTSWTIDGTIDLEDHSIFASFEPTPLMASFASNPPSDDITTSDLVQFTDTSQNGPSSWAWDFGDGTTSSEQHPVHTFGETGTYTVTLSISNGLVTDSYSLDFTVASEYLSSSVVLWGSLEGYSSIQAAYDRAYYDLGLTNETIRIKAEEQIVEDLFFDEEMIFSLEGGYDSEFLNVISASRVDGKVTISHGTINMSNIILGPISQY